MQPIAPSGRPATATAPPGPPTRHPAAGAAWLTFAELREEPRGAAASPALAEAFRTATVSGLCRPGRAKRDAARRFVHLVDALCPAGDRGDEFRRTASRLVAMQSREHLAEPHVGSIAPGLALAGESR